jgi:ABC-type transport system substrate-binding protein
MPLWYWTGSYAAQRETAEAVALYLRAVGINPQVDGRDATQMIGVIRQYHSGPPAPAVLLSPAPIANMPSSADMLNFVFSSHSPFAQYNNPAFDKVAAEANQTVDKAKQAELVREAVRILHKDVVVIPIWTNVTVFAMQKNIDFKPAPRGAMLVRLDKVKVEK